MSILVTGGTGMIGHAIKEIMPQAKFIGSSMYDLRNQNDVEFLFYKEKPDYVLHLAAKVGGVEANYKNPGKFYYDNIMINTNVLECSRKHKVKKVLSNKDILFSIHYNFVSVKFFYNFFISKQMFKMR